MHGKGGHVWQGEAHAWQGHVHGRGVSMAGGMHGRGNVWQGEGVHGMGECMAGAYAWQRGVHGREHGRGACVTGGMHGGVCIVVGGTWQGACMAGETATAADGTHPTGNAFLF